MRKKKAPNADPLLRIIDLSSVTWLFFWIKWTNVFIMWLFFTLSFGALTSLLKGELDPSRCVGLLLFAVTRRVNQFISDCRWSQTPACALALAGVSRPGLKARC
jgi:hypothetical protein